MQDDFCLLWKLNCVAFIPSPKIYNTDDRFNIPSVTECSDLLNEWVYPHNGDLSKLRSTAPRELPEYVRRFTQDVYLCVYVNTDAILYGY